jgi:hypothetical protein
MIATISGTAKVIPSSTGYGNRVIIENENYSVQYAHLRSMNVTNGQQISVGQNIAASGNTGTSTGPHLDYKVIVKDPVTGKPFAIDPADAMGKDLNDPAVRADLIAKAEAKLDGNPLLPEGTPIGSGPDQQPSHDGPLIGCDTSVLEEGQKIVDALNEAQIEAAKAIITKPNPLGVTGCEDQHHNIIEQIMGEFSNFGGGNQSLVKNVKEPHAQHTGQFFGPQNIAGTMTSALQQAFVGTFGQAGQDVLNTAQNVNNTVNNFASSLGGLFGGGGGNASKDCGLQEDAWLIAQCIEMPQIPSLSNILGGKIAEIQGAIQGVADLANPERLLQKVCSGANDKVKGLFGAATDKFKDAADAVTTPITDSAASLTN